MKAEPAKALILAITLALAVAVSMLFLHGAPRAFPLDDAYIHLCYARNLAQGNGFSFNPGEPSFGTTSPLWVFILALFIRFLEPHLLVRLIAGICLWLSLYLGSAIIREQLREKSLSTPVKVFFIFFPALFLAASGNFLWIVFSGMESALFCALTLASIFLLIRKKPAWFGYPLMGLLVLTRFEAVFLIPLVLLWQWFHLEDKKKMWGILVSIVLPLAFHAWAYFALGHFLPTTRSGKLASDLFNSGISLKGGWVFFTRHILYLWHTQQIFQPALLLAIAAVLSLIWTNKSKINIGPAGMLAIFALMIFLYHDQFFRSTQLLTPYHNFRYQVLFFPAVAIGLTAIFGRLYEIGLAQKKDASAIIWILVIVMVPSSVFLRKWHTLFLDQSRHVEEVHQLAARWASYNLPESSRIACFDIGSLGFYSDRYVIDLGGLTDPKIYPYLRKKEVGGYLEQERATHYIELGTPGSERMVGVRKDEGKLYELKPVMYFAGTRVREPVLLHSWEMKVFELDWLEPKPEN